MPDLEKAINALGRCESYGYCEDKKCPYYENTDCLELLRKDALFLLKAQNEVITELRKVGYPHNFQGLQPWIVDYMNLITEVIKKAVRLE